MRRILVFSLEDESAFLGTCGPELFFSDKDLMFSFELPQGPFLPEGTVIVFQDGEITWNFVVKLPVYFPENDAYIFPVKVNFVKKVKIKERLEIVYEFLKRKWVAGNVS